jgi:hypothetical protein
MVTQKRRICMIAHIIQTTQTKKQSILVLVFALGLLTFQNAYSKEPRSITYKDSTNRYVLWRVHTQNSTDDNRWPWGAIVKVDSVLRENFYINEEWLFYYEIEIEKNVYESRKPDNLVPNSYYIALATAVCSESRVKTKTCHLLLDDFLPDAPENRKKLSKKWDETKVIYPEPYKPGIGDMLGGYMGGMY